MYNDDPKNPTPPDPNTPPGAAPAPWFGRRKRIVSREVDPSASNAAVTNEMQSAVGGNLHPAELIDAPPPPPPLEAEALVVDPTAYNVRHRKRSENLVYRLTQAILLLSFIGGAIAIAAAFNGDPTPALWIAIASCALAIAAVWLVRSSRLAYRLRGYAAAACVCAVIALIFAFIPMPAHEEDAPGIPATTRPARDVRLKIDTTAPASRPATRPRP